MKQVFNISFSVETINKYANTTTIITLGKNISLKFNNYIISY